MDEAIRRIEAAQAEGLAVTADMYPYHASSTGLDAIMPGWVQEGGHDAWVARLKDPQVRQRLMREIVGLGDVAADGAAGENSYVEAGSAENILLGSFRNEALKPLAGRTLAEVAAMRGTSPLETAFDLIIEDNSRVGCIYFTMSEDNLRKQMALPWVSFCSDSASLAPEGVFLKTYPHPRAYGSFARVLGNYVREEKVLSLQEAVRRLAALPAENLRLKDRGRLRPGYYADVVVFDPAAIQDHATFARPHQYATGVSHVLVNGVPVLQDGEHTGATPGRVVGGNSFKMH
jgi:N-acyl-D-amino-acid deacylase